MFYDYRSNDVFQDIIVDDISEIIEDIVDEYCKLKRDGSINVFCKAAVANELIAEMRELFEELYIDEESDMNLLQNNKNDILITFAIDGCIFVEEPRAINGNLKMSDGFAVNYIQDCYSSTDVKNLAKEENYILTFGFANEEEEKHVEISKDVDGDMHGFSASKHDGNTYMSYSYYTSEKLDRSDIDQILKSFGF